MSDKETWVFCTPSFSTVIVWPMVVVEPDKLTITIPPEREDHFSGDHQIIKINNGPNVKRGDHYAREIANFVYDYLMTNRDNRTSLKIGD